MAAERRNRSLSSSPAAADLGFVRHPLGLASSVAARQAAAHCQTRAATHKRLADPATGGLG
jgi:hypothetical protein